MTRRAETDVQAIRKATQTLTIFVARCGSIGAWGVMVWSMCILFCNGPWICIDKNRSRFLRANAPHPDYLSWSTGALAICIESSMGCRSHLLRLCGRRRRILRHAVLGVLCIRDVAVLV